MILDPIKYFMFTISMGFMCNIFLMMTWILLYERVSQLTIVEIPKRIDILSKFCTCSNTNESSPSSDDLADLLATKGFIQSRFLHLSQRTNRKHGPTHFYDYSGHDHSELLQKIYLLVWSIPVQANFINVVLLHPSPYTGRTPTFEAYHVSSKSPQVDCSENCRAGCNPIMHRVLFR